MPSPAKRVKILSDASSDDDSDHGVQLPKSNAHSFQINEEYARRFEYNKKREEKQRLEEKYQSKRKRAPSASDDDGEDNSDDSTDESEDDDAELATKDLDGEIFATLAAIKNKDPRVYDKNVKFYKDWENDAADPAESKDKKSKPMYLQDYHRQQLMAGKSGQEEEDEEKETHVQTHEEEQAALRNQLVGEMHAAQAAAEDQDSEGSDEEMFEVKAKPKHELLPDTKSKVNSARAKQITDQDVLNADKDPETYLSNFMVSRAWLPDDGWRFKGQEFDSDDSDSERRADEFENAYNMRFEDPETANEKLKTFSRDAAAKSSVRREEKSGRKRTRDLERAKKEAEKEETRKERERLKKLRVDEVEEKVHRIKEAAGLGDGDEIDLQQWKPLLEGDFTDKQWDELMAKRFGEQYYAEEDPDTKEKEGSSKKSKPKKPKFEDDIDIKDIIPDFDDSNDAPPALLSDEEGEDELPSADIMDIDEEDEGAAKHKSHKQRKQDSINAKRTARKERANIEALVDANMPIEHPHLSISKGKAPTTGYRYRETSPTTFGLTARDILFASDADLNQFAGLKKMATFRDERRKANDRKKLSKKNRLRQWRKDTFGRAEAPEGGFEQVLGTGDDSKGAESKSRSGKKRGAKKSKKAAS